MRIENQIHFYSEKEFDEQLEAQSFSPSFLADSHSFFERERLSKIQQRCKIERNERIGLNCVQAFINNISFSSSLEELWDYSNESLVDGLLKEDETEWTVPKWAKAGDIVFFMHTKTARSTITRLRTELNSERGYFSSENYQVLMDAINRGLETYSKYGGKIFAIGRVSGGPKYDQTDGANGNLYHWSSRHYAEIDNVIPLKTPIDISEFNSFILVTRGAAITPVWGTDFDNLKRVISKKNELPWFVEESSSTPVPLRKISSENWISTANDYRRCFILEEQFRSFYVDFLLSSIGDKKKFYSECRCVKPGINPSFIDNVFLFKGKYLAVEVKLSVAAEANINAQVAKYCYNSSIRLDVDGKTITGDDMHSGKVLVIDTDSLYMYDAKTDLLKQIFSLDDLQTRDDLLKVKAAISTNL